MKILIAAFAGLLLLAPDVAAAQTLRSSGSGFSVAPGWLLTNAHVVNDCQRVEVAGSGRVTDTRVDDSNDLALLRVSDADLPPLVFRSTAVRLGEDILAIGFPLAGLLSDSIKVTTGNVNALAGMGNDARYIQISTPIQPGNSGGPIIDRDGFLVGITAATLSKEFADKLGITNQNVNFAIRAKAAEFFLQSEGVTNLVGQRSDAQVAPSTADLAERVTSSVRQVLCYGAPEKGTDNIVENSANPGPGLAAMVEASGYDAIGFDYATRKGVSFAGCKAACEGDSQCKAVTYNTRYDFCFLKQDVVALIRNGDAIAAYVPSKAADLVVSDFTSYSNADIPGGDYRHLTSSTYIQCFVACVGDPVCRAFAYVRRHNECWLKDQLGAAHAKKGVDLGVK